MVSSISHIYSSQLFQVKAAGHTSDILEAASGIRQGCPLSPYLFLIVHSMIFYDVDHQLAAEGGMMPWVFSQQRHFYDLAYADDTALVEQLLGVVESTAAHSNLTLNWGKCLLLISPASRNHVYNATGGMVKETEHAKYLGVILSRNGTARKDVNERLAKARKHFSTLHHFWRHSGLPVHWKLRIYNAVFIPMLTYGMESASLSQHDLHRLEAFHSKALRKMHRIPATFYTKILEPTQPTTTNQQLREQTSQPPLTHHIHRAQLKLFGHILRAQDKCLERDCCSTKAFMYRSGTPGDGLRRGRPRTHWAEQCAVLAWHWLQELDPHPTQAHPVFPFAYVHLHRLAARPHFWSQLVGLSTCRKLLKRQTYAVYSTVKFCVCQSLRADA